MATGPFTIEDFERLPDELAENHELVDGEFIDVSGNTAIHILLRDLLGAALRVFVRQRKLGQVFTGLDYDFEGNAHGPDVSFISSRKLALVEMRKRVQRFVPDLAIEVASESDSFLGLLRQKERYRKAGTSEVWLISIDTREVFIFASDRRLILGENDMLSTGLLPGFGVTLEDLFAQI